MSVDFDATPSLERLGICPTVQPNVETIEKMRKSYSSSTGKIRAWISWMIKVAEEAQKWYAWLENRILVVQTILNVITGEYFINRPQNRNEKKIKREKELRKKREDKILPDDDEENPPQLLGEINRIQDDEEEPLSPQARATVNEKLNEATDQPHHWINEVNSGGVLGTSNVFDKIPSPIGVPWVPQVFDKKKSKRNERKKSELVKRTLLPKTRQELAKFMMQMKHQAIIYRSLYKHWKEITNQARESLMHRQVIAQENNITHEKIPYFFYLYCPPNIDIAIERYNI